MLRKLRNLWNIFNLNNLPYAFDAKTDIALQRFNMWCKLRNFCISMPKITIRLSKLFETLCKFWFIDSNRKVKKRKFKEVNCHSVWKCRFAITHDFLSLSLSLAFSLFLSLTHTHIHTHTLRIFLIANQHNIKCLLRNRKIEEKIFCYNILPPFRKKVP